MEAAGGRWGAAMVLELAASLGAPLPRGALRAIPRAAQDRASPAFASSYGFGCGRYPATAGALFKVAAVVE